jgi:DNA helicase II / ATP-dependent DNA helicase PcrA
VVADHLLRGLTDAQRLAVTTDEAPLCVLAGAGSGKTTVLTRRVARRVLDGTADPRHILVATFTRKAAAELRSRIARLGVEGDIWAGTLHAAAYRQLRRYWADRQTRAPSILDDPTRLIRKVLTDLPGRSGSDGAAAISAVPGAVPTGLPGAVANVAAEIHWAQARLVSPDDYERAARQAARSVPISPQAIAEVYGRYREEKRRRGVLDLDDLLGECTRLLENDTDFAAAQRWHLRHLFVDEFQDLNPAQWRLLEAWLGERVDLFVVGDPRQAVYAWNGSDPTLINRLPELIPGTSVVRLDQNHRSSPQIVGAARAVLREDAGEQQQQPDTEEAVDDSLDGPPPRIEGFDDDEAEATAVSRWLRLAHRPGTSWSSLAVLARTNARLEPIAAALRRAGIPHMVASAAAQADDPRRQALRQTLSVLRGMPVDRPLRNALAELTILSEAGPESCERPCDAGDGLEGDSRNHGMPLEIADLADEFAADEPGATVGGFLAWVAATDAWSDTGERVIARDDRVELATFHKAKGLEWRAVAVVGLEDGIVPIAYAASAEAMAEERRLLYVALTRAQQELWCSWAGTRHDGDRTWACDRSPFLEAVEAAVVAAAPINDLEHRRARISELRSRLAAAG